MPRLPLCFLLPTLGIVLDSRTGAVVSRDQAADTGRGSSHSSVARNRRPSGRDHLHPPAHSRHTEDRRPAALVIDLPGASLALAQKHIDFRNPQVRGIRLNQFQRTPAVARVVVDLLGPVDYTWDATGNRLMIRLHAEEDSPPPPKPQWTTAVSAGAQPAYLPVNSTTSGAVMLAGSRLAGRSSVSAGSETAVLRLARGGEVRVCPGTTVSVTPSQNNRQLMVGMSTGGVEEHFSLGTTADSVVTPDFRILLAGPGEFHYAFRVDTRGNTCVRALPGNTASVVVSELLGDGTYQVKPTEQVVFRGGRVGLIETALPTDCGCPAPEVPVMMASSRAPAVLDADDLGPIRLAQGGEKSAGMSSRSDYALSEEAWAGLSPETAPLPATKPNELHVQVDAPFVFRAVPAPDAGPALPLADARGRPPLLAPALPPDTNSQRRGIFKKIKGFFVTIFS